MLLSSPVLKQAYRQLAKLYHPDNHQTGNAEVFKLLSAVYERITEEKTTGKTKRRTPKESKFYPQQQQQSSPTAPPRSRQSRPHQPNKYVHDMGTTTFDQAEFQSLYEKVKQQPPRAKKKKYVRDMGNYDPGNHQTLYEKSKQEAARKTKPPKPYVRERGNAAYGQREHQSLYEKVKQQAPSRSTKQYVYDRGTATYEQKNHQSLYDEVKKASLHAKASSPEADVFTSTITNDLFAKAAAKWQTKAQTTTRARAPQQKRNRVKLNQPPTFSQPQTSETTVPRQTQQAAVGNAAYTYPSQAQTSQRTVPKQRQQAAANNGAYTYPSQRHTDLHNNRPPPARRRETGNSADSPRQRHRATPNPNQSTRFGESQVGLDATATVPLTCKGTTTMVPVAHQVPCSHCQGTGSVVQQSLSHTDLRQCPHCRGQGTVDKQVSVAVTIPATAVAGTVVFMGSQGYPGPAGPGDLYVTIGP